MLFNVFWGVSWAHVWPSWGALGGSFGGLGVFRWLPEILKLLFLHPGAPKLPPEEPSTAPNSAPGALIVKQMAPRSHHGPHFGTDAFRHLIKNLDFATGICLFLINQRFR